MRPERRFKLLLVLIVTAQVLFLTLLFALRMLLLATGEPALLTVDWHGPRQLPRAGYVRLNYDVARVELARVETDIGDAGELQGRQLVYVVWERVDRYHEVAGLFLDRPRVREDQLLVRARVSWHSRDTVFLEYGVERYYVPPSARELTVNTIEAEVRVSPRGDLLLGRVYVNGQELWQ